MTDILNINAYQQQSICNIVYKIIKRLFLHLSEQHQLRFLEKLSLEKIDIGSGKRVIGEGGKFDKKWLISVPRSDLHYGRLENENE